MIMRYHWGLAIGHTYTNYAADPQATAASASTVGSSNSPDHEDAEGALAEDTHPASPSRQDVDMAEDDNSDTENLEFSLDDWEDVDLGYGEESDREDERDPSDDETFIAMGEMYGFELCDE